MGFRESSFGRSRVSDPGALRLQGLCLLRFGDCFRALGLRSFWGFRFRVYRDCFKVTGRVGLGWVGIGAGLGQESALASTATNKKQARA